MTRSSKKGPFVHPVLMQRVAMLDAENKKQPLKTFSRSCVIAPEFIGHTFQVYNGQKFIPVFCTESMVGHRLGEFAPTRLFRGHGGKLAKAQS